MKKLFNWFFSNPPARGDSLDFATAFLRIFAGLAMIPYGIGKIENYDKLKTSFFGDPVGLGDEPSLILCIFQQIFCAAMLVLGIQSRFAAFMLFTNMAVAVKFHFFDPGEGVADSLPCDIRVFSGFGRRRDVGRQPDCKARRVGRGCAFQKGVHACGVRFGGCAVGQLFCTKRRAVCVAFGRGVCTFRGGCVPALKKIGGRDLRPPFRRNSD